MVVSVHFQFFSRCLNNNDLAKFTKKGTMSLFDGIHFLPKICTTFFREFFCTTIKPGKYK